MTREEAVIILDGFKNNPLFNSTHIRAFDMAISALSESDNVGMSMSHRAIAKVIDDYVDNHRGDSDKQYTALEIKLLLISDDSAKNKYGWIPIEERKPNEYDDVLVSTDIEEVFEATYYGDELGFDDNNGNFYEGEVIAWQPKPKSYKENGNERKGGKH